MASEVRLVWLRPGIKHKTAHAYDDYIKSSFVNPFLAELSVCGVRRDPLLRIPADELGDRKCRRCLVYVERTVRRGIERAAALEKYGTKENDHEE